MGEISFNLGPFIINALNFNTTFVIKEQVESAKGKWADGLGNVMTVDSGQIAQLLVASFRARLS